MALERCWQSQPRQVTALLERLVESGPSEQGEHTLRRTLVALQVARDLGVSPASVELLPRHLMHFLTQERSTWKRRLVGEEVRSLALHGGPLWNMLWRELEPVLLTPDSHSAWLARQEDDPVEDWIDRLRDPDLAVRVVATRKLARWKQLPEVQEVLLGQLSDEGHNFGFNLEEEPALAAALVLRELPHSEALRQRLMQLLQDGPWLAAGAAAVALLPGEAPAEDALFALQQLHQSGRTFSVVLQVVDAYRDVPEGRAWLARYWPGAPSATARESSIPHSPEPGGSRTPPVSSVVRRELLWVIAPALREAALRKRLQLAGFDPREIARAVCSVAMNVPEAAVELVGDTRFFPWDAQEALGQAALQHPRIGRALVERWHRRVDARHPELFPGLALEPLVARGEADAVRSYAEWLPRAVNMVVPFPRRPLLVVMAQPEVQEAARVAALNAWKQATENKLGSAPLGGLLRALWPAWAQEETLREGLVAWVREGDLERMKAALRAWLQGDFPSEVAEALANRINRMDTWPREAHFFEEAALPLWLAAAWRAGISRQVEPVLRALVTPSKPAPALYQACLYLMRLNPAEAEHWVRSAAAAWPFHWTDHPELTRDDIRELVSSFPEIWARAGLDRLKEYGSEVVRDFLQMVDQLRSALPPGSSLRAELVEALRGIASIQGTWQSLDFMRPVVLLDDEAQRLLFLMKEPVALPPEE